MTGGGTDEMAYSWSVDDAMCLTELCASESGKLDCPVASFNPHPSAGPKSSSSSIQQSCKGRQSQSRLQKVLLSKFYHANSSTGVLLWMHSRAP